MVKKIKAIKAQAPVILPPVVAVVPVPDQKSQTINHLIANSDTSSLSRLVAHYGYDLKQCMVDGATPLHSAAKKGDLTMTSLLLSYDMIDINKVEARKVGGNAALHYACIENHPAIVNALVQKGANVDIRTDNSFGDTPLHICCKLDRPECAQILMNNDCDINARDNNGYNASFWAMGRNHAHLIKDLGLPPSAAPSANDAITMMLQRRTTLLPSLRRKKKKKGTKKDGEKKTLKKKK